MDKAIEDQGTAYGMAVAEYVTRGGDPNAVMVKCPVCELVNVGPGHTTPLGHPCPFGKTEAPALCVNARIGLEFWFCLHYNGKITPGTEALNENGECAACAKVSALTIDSEPPSFMLPDVDL
jgi:hypothetical protein